MDPVSKWNPQNLSSKWPRSAVSTKLWSVPRSASGSTFASHDICEPDRMKANMASDWGWTPEACCHCNESWMAEMWKGTSLVGTWHCDTFTCLVCWVCGTHQFLMLHAAKLPHVGCIWQHHPRYSSQLEEVSDSVEKSFKMYLQVFKAKRVPWR